MIIVFLLAWIIVGGVCGWHFAKKKYREDRELGFGVIESTFVASFTYILSIILGFVTGFGLLMVILLPIILKSRDK